MAFLEQFMGYKEGVKADRVGKWAAHGFWIVTALGPVFNR